MDDVARPEEPPLMRDAMKPVIRQVFRKEARNQHRPRPGKRKDAMLVDPEVRIDRDACEQEAGDLIAEAHEEARGAIAKFVAAMLGEADRDHLNKDQQHEAGHGERDDEVLVQRLQRRKDAVRSGIRWSRHRASPAASAVSQGGGASTRICSGG
jgi:hypothetical protein